MKTMFEISTIPIAIYLGFTLLLFTFQRSFIYYPHKEKAPLNLLDAERLQYWPEEKNFRGFISTNNSEMPQGTVIIFHGNAGAAYHRTYYSHALTKQNLRVILAEYPGYGGRSGDQSEELLVKDAIEIVELAHEMYGGPIYLWGESLGSGVVASTVAKTNVPIPGVVMFTPFDSLAEVAQSHYWYLPTRWLVKDQYKSVENLKEFKGNIAVILAENDKVIPIKHGQKLYESISANKKLWIFDNAGHNTIPVEPNRDWWREVSQFIASHSKI